MRHRLPPLAAIVVGLLLAAPVLASHVQPQVVSEATSCAPLVPGTIELLVEVPQGLTDTVTDGDFTVDVNLAGGLGNGTVSFDDATLPVKAAFVAGVDSGHLYVYEEPVRADDGLTAPDGQRITAVSLCYVTESAGGGDGGASEAPSDTGGGGEGGGGTAPPSDMAAEAVAPPRAGLLPTLMVAVGLGLVATGLVLFRVRGLQRR
jgi:hypothetical protein